MSSTVIENIAYRYSRSTDQGMRKYMEDITQVDCEDLAPKTSFFAIFDGHGGKEAATFARDHLWKNIKSSPDFESEDPEMVKSAIKKAFRITQIAMQSDIENWPKRKDGTKSTSGTTVTCAILRGRSLFIAQLGDSRAVMATKDQTGIHGRFITAEHKPEDPAERSRIESIGGAVAISNGTCRVVWRRPKSVREAPTSPSDQTATSKQHPEYEDIPFLAVARSLGDLWSFSPDFGDFLVSPDPEVTVHTLEKHRDLFIILASDGLWGMMNSHEAAKIIHDYDQGRPDQGEGASKNLVKKALDRWRRRKLRADNISAMVVFFDNDGRNSETESMASTEVEDAGEVEIENGSEETPTDLGKVENAETMPRKLVRQNAERWTDLEAFKRRFNLDCLYGNNQTKTETRDASRTTSGSGNGGDGDSLKRKSTDNEGSEEKCKKSKTSSPSSNVDMIGCHLKTDVSQESLDSLKLDKE
eukprot:gene14107-15581_t